LALLYARPDEAFYLRQVTREARGREIHYRANRACPIFAELQGLVLKTVGLADVLRGPLMPLHDGISLAVVYGSHAAGTAISASNVDLVVVGDLDEMALHKAIGQAEARLHRTVNYILLSRRVRAPPPRARGVPPADPRRADDSQPGVARGRLRTCSGPVGSAARRSRPPRSARHSSWLSATSKSHGNADPPDD